MAVHDLHKVAWKTRVVTAKAFNTAANLIAAGQTKLPRSTEFKEI